MMITKGGSASDPDHDNPNNGSRHAWYLIDGLPRSHRCTAKTLNQEFGPEIPRVSNIPHHRHEGYSCPISSNSYS